jgi:hypothetical protein
VAEGQILHIELDLTVDSEPICGRLRVGTVRDYEFSGLLELVALLDLVRRDGASHPKS